MPINQYYSGNGEAVLRHMVDQYGPKKAKSVFYALAAKKKLRPEDPAAEPESLPRIRRKYSLEGKRRLI